MSYAVVRLSAAVDEGRVRPFRVSSLKSPSAVNLSIKFLCCSAALLLCCSAALLLCCSAALRCRLLLCCCAPHLAQPELRFVHVPARVKELLGSSYAHPPPVLPDTACRDTGKTGGGAGLRSLTAGETGPVAAIETGSRERERGPAGTVLRRGASRLFVGI